MSSFMECDDVKPRPPVSQRIDPNYYKGPGFTAIAVGSSIIIGLGILTYQLGRDKNDGLIQNDFLTGSVLEEKYSSSPVERGSSTYNLKLRLDQGGEVVLNVIEKRSGEREALESLVKPGSHISFPKKGYYFDDEFKSEMQIVSRYATDIKVLPRAPFLILE